MQAEIGVLVSECLYNNPSKLKRDDTTPLDDKLTRRRRIEAERCDVVGPSSWNVASFEEANFGRQLACRPDAERVVE